MEAPEEAPPTAATTPVEKTEAGITLLIKNVNVSVIDTPKKLFEYLGLAPKDIISHRFRSVPVHPKFAKNPYAGIRRKQFLPNLPCQMYIVVKTRIAADRALEKNTGFFEDSHIFVTEVPAHKQKLPFDRSKSVFVQKIPSSWTEEHLFALFKQIGPITNIRLVRHAITHESQHFAYVQFSAKASVSQAIKKLHNSEMPGNQKLVVERCKKLDEMPESKCHKKMKEANKNKPKQQKIIFKNLKKNAKKKLLRAIAAEKKK